MKVDLIEVGEKSVDRRGKGSKVFSPQRHKDAKFRKGAFGTRSKINVDPFVVLLAAMPKNEERFCCQQH